MATVTLTALATAAVEDLGVIDAGGTLSASQLAQALAAANTMLDNWSSQKLLVARSLLQSQAYTAATQSYTLTALKVEAAHNVLAAGPSNKINVLNAEQWSALPDRQRQSYLVENCFYDRAATTPKIYFSPIPVASTGSAELTLWVAHAQFVDATTAYTLLPGYQQLMQFGLAMVLAPKYGRTPSPQLKENYQQALAAVASLNASLFGPDGVDAGAAPEAVAAT